MFTDALFASLSQLGIFVGVVYIVGFLISLINRFFYRSTGQGRAVCLATGLIGTPIHELSHAAMCILFCHRITDMKLYSPDESNGILGYVNHSYNRRNPYQVTGNYFIGVAPILAGTAFLYFLIRLLLPAAFTETEEYLAEFAGITASGFSAGLFSYFFAVIGGILKSLFTIDFGVKTVIFLAVCLCVSLHMNLSAADIRSSLGALPIIAVMLFAVNLILQIVSEYACFAFRSFLTKAGCYLVAMLALSLAFSAMILILGIVVRAITSVFKR